MIRRLFSFATAAAIMLAAPLVALADGPKVLFVSPAATPFSARVRAEIEAMGFDVEPSAVLTREGTQAIAAARVVEGEEKSVELWIADATGRLMLRAFIAPSLDGDEDSQTARASEQLRAFFQPLRTPPPPPPPVIVKIAPPAEPPARVAPSHVALPNPSAPPRPRFVLGAGLAVPIQPGGPALDLELSARWMPAAHVGLGAFASVPVAGSTLKATEGNASLTVPLFGLDVSASASPTSWLRASASAGLAIAWVRASGFASAPYHGLSVDTVTAAPIFGAALAPRITDRVRLYADGRAGFSLSRVDITFAGRTVASWGRPLGMIGAGVAVDL